MGADSAMVSGEAAEAIDIEVDPSRSRNENKSLGLALLYSTVVPGGGELYLQEKRRAKAFLLAETGFWAALFTALLAQDSYLQSARNFASAHAGIDASRKDEDFLELMGKYRAYQEKQHRQDSYELAQILAGKRDRNYEVPAREENFWDFGSSADPENTKRWREYQTTLRYYRGSKIALSFAAGALALNRVASLVSTLHLYRTTSTRSTALAPASSPLALRFVPEIAPDFAGARLSLSF